MEFVKKYKVVLLIVLPVLILVLFRAFSSNHFQNDANKWAELSLKSSNIITLNKINSMPGKFLLINLDTIQNTNDKIGNSLSIKPGSILERENLKTIRSFKGAVLLSSSRPDVSARIWMILSQMGMRNLYILTSDSDNEVFKNKFQPDTIRPEL
jgi:hypothetical protein